MRQMTEICPECGMMRQAGSYSEMDLDPSAEDCARVEVKGGVDFEFQEPKYHVQVIYDSPFESVPADKTLGFSGILQDKMESEGVVPRLVVLERMLRKNAAIVVANKMAA